ncbi:MAG: alpha-amylase [Bacteroidales bacterium]|nr:alpha-amylase [Bacteroidales bacterium]
MDKPIIYQILPRLWGPRKQAPVRGGTLDKNGCGTFQDIDKQTFDYLKGLGISHVWYTGILRHATRCTTSGCTPSSAQWVKGEAGSPYSITDYYDVNPYLATDPSHRMEEFEDLVRRTHEAGLKVIIDFVPNHVARDYGRFSDGTHPVFGADDDTSVHWRAENDFFYYPGQALKLPVPGDYQEYPARASGNCYSAEPSVNDWYDTVKLNYCDSWTPTWDKMKDILLYWTGKGVDGFRCDMVELVPAEFMQWVIAEVRKVHPGTLFIAEVYQKNLYAKYVREVGFDYLYDKSGLYDTLHDIVHKQVHDSGVPVEQWQSTRRITWNWQSLNELQPYLLNFLENHDEQRIASSFFADNGYNGLAALHVSLLFNTAPFMLYFGQEAGERGMDQEGMSGLDGRTTIFDWWSPASIRHIYESIHGRDALTTEESSLLSRYKRLLHLAATDPAIRKGDTYDLCYCNLSSNGFNQDSHFAFLRHYEGETLLIVSNFTPRAADIEISIPAHAFDWLHIPRTDTLNERIPVPVHVEPMDGIIVRL